MSHDKSYWKKRQEERFLQGEKSIDEYYTELKKAFEQAQKEIQFVINDFYLQYATENRISYTEAQKRLSKAQVGKLRDYINKVNETMGTYNLELSNMSIKARITRYEALNMQIDAILQYLYAIDYEIKGAKSLMHIYADNHLHMWYNFDIYTGFHHEFAQIIPSDIEQLIAYPFNGQNFSERLWKQKDYLKSKLQESLTTIMVLGQDPARLAKDFAKHFQAREYEAYRLLHTETSFVMEQSTLSAYKESDVEWYQILATLDNKTSEICREQDGKIYKVEDATVGTNYPPFHMFCRTTTVPDYGEKSEGVRMARDSTGKAVEVPADMTYREWEKKYIKVSRNKEMGARSALEWIKRDEEAENYYDTIRKRNDDIGKIARNTGFSEKDIRSIKEHVFINSHILDYGRGRFDANYDMAIAWQRLINGNFEDRDLVLLNHELLESIVEKEYNCTYREAHNMAEEKHDWDKIIDDLFGGDGENVSLDELIRKEK